MTEIFCYPADEYVLLGKIARAHGLRGEVKVFLHSGQPENLRNYKEVFLIARQGELAGPFPIVSSRGHGKLAIVQFASIDTRDLAEALEGLDVLVAKANLPEIAEDEYYWYQYLGKAVVDTAGNVIGKVDNIFRNGLQDVLVIKRLETDEEILVPVAGKIIVRETAGELIIDPPPGLLEVNAGR
jgi:16S rRNA processing protein RimM